MYSDNELLVTPLTILTNESDADSQTGWVWIADIVLDSCCTTFVPNRTKFDWSLKLSKLVYHDATTEESK